jgi:hypothetical protein
MPSTGVHSTPALGLVADVLAGVDGVDVDVLGAHLFHVPLVGTIAQVGEAVYLGEVAGGLRNVGQHRKHLGGLGLDFKLVAQMDGDGDGHWRFSSEVDTNNCP